MAMLVILGYMANPAQALTTEEAHAVSAGDNDARIQALHELIPKNDARLPVLVQALLNDSVKVSGEKAYIVEDDKVLDAATGLPTTLPEDAEDVTNNGRMSGELEAVLAVDKLLSPDVAVRAEAVSTIAKSVDESKLPMIDKALSIEASPQLKTQLQNLRAKALLSGTDAAKRIEAAQELAASADPETQALLMERLQDGVETDPKVKLEVKKALDSIASRLARSCCWPRWAWPSPMA
jgi:urea transport system permease protein